MQALSPAVEGALRSLVAPGRDAALGHANDRKAAIQAFVILLDAGEELDKESIYDWLTQNHRTEEQASVFTALIEDVENMRDTHTRPVWAADILNKWRERV